MLKPSDGVFKKLFNPNKMAQTRKPPAGATPVGRAVAATKTAARKPVKGGIFGRAIGAMKGY